MKKIFTVPLLLLFVAISICGQQINNENLRIIHGPYIQNLTGGGATVIWHTNLPSVPSLVVSGGGIDNMVVRNSHDGIIDGGGRVHRVRLTTLEPGVQYSYVPVSVQVLKYQPYRVYYGDTIKGKKDTFITPAEGSKQIRFTVFNDIHENAGLMSAFINAGKNFNPDLYFFNGDMVDYLQDEKQLYNGFIDTAVAHFATSVPFYYVRGNHETRGMLARDLKQYFDYPSGRFYYSFTQGPVRFIILDGGEDKSDDNRYYYGLADYDSYRNDQLEWLADELRDKNRGDVKFTVVIIHMPVIKSEKQGYGMQYLSEKFGPVLSEAGIDLMISGHTHRTASLDRGESGFNYPVVISSNKTYTEIEAIGKELRWWIKDSEGAVVDSGIIK